MTLQYMLNNHHCVNTGIGNVKCLNDYCSETNLLHLYISLIYASTHTYMCGVCVLCVCACMCLCVSVYTDVYVHAHVKVLKCKH